jgi:hypothetical protein
MGFLRTMAVILCRTSDGFVVGRYASPRAGLRQQGIFTRQAFDGTTSQALGRKLPLA